MTNYILCDGNGNELYAGLQDNEAEQIAQRTANEICESVFLYAEDPADDSEGQEYGSPFYPDAWLNK